MRPYLKKKPSRKRAGGMAKGGAPEYKLQYQKKEKIILHLYIHTIYMHTYIHTYTHTSLYMLEMMAKIGRILVLHKQNCSQNKFYWKLNNFQKE
jgi:hypothetical protein